MSDVTSIFTHLEFFTDNLDADAEYYGKRFYQEIDQVENWCS